MGPQRGGHFPVGHHHEEEKKPTLCISFIEFVL